MRLLDTRPTLIAVSGPTGIGRSALLSAAADELGGRGVRTVLVRCSPGDRDTRYGLLYRIISSINPLATPGRPPGTALPPLLDLVAQAGTWPERDRPQLVVHLGTALAEDIAARGPLAILVDDLQWADEATLRVLEPLVARGADLEFAIAISVRSHRPDNEAAAAKRALPLRSERHVRWLRLTSLTEAGTAAMLSDLLASQPDPELVDEVHRLSRGNPAAVRGALDGLRAVGRIQAVDGHVFLDRGTGTAVLPRHHPLVEQVRALGPGPQAVAGALSVLAPLGEPAAALIAEVSGMSIMDVESALGALIIRNLVEPAESGWRFRLPLLADTLRGRLGPVQQLRTNATAARAVLGGTATPPDDFYLAECLVIAGRCLPTQQAGLLLAEAAARVLPVDRHRAIRFCAAAAELLPPPARQELRALHAQACLAALRCTEAAELAKQALAGAAALPAWNGNGAGIRKLWSLVQVYVQALGGLRERAVLEEFISTGWRDLPVPAGWLVVARALVMYQLEQLTRAKTELERERHLWSSDPVVAVTGNALLASIRRSIGEPQPEQSRPDPRQDRVGIIPGIIDIDAVPRQVSVQLSEGELDRPVQLMAQAGIPLDRLPPAQQSLVHYRRGDWADALRVARRAETSSARDTAACRSLKTRLVAARVLIARGGFARARTWLARDNELLLGLHMIDCLTAELHYCLGEYAEAGLALARCLHLAGRNGYLLSTEEPLELQVSVEVETGHLDRAKETLDRLEQTGARLGTDQARLAILRAGALVHSDPAMAGFAVDLARTRAQPFELATTLLLTARVRSNESALLAEAYELFGDLDALVWRARVRAAMRDAQVPVPGRGVAAEETDRLLTLMVADGFSNRQIAHVLHTSQKGVEGRLSRLFARAGYRSRVELAAAVHTGTPHW